MQHVDVAIVGLGPVGSAGAVFLAEAGLSVAVFEQDREVYRLPRAVGMDGEIVRAFQAIGRGEEFNALIQPIREGERAGFANSKREWMFGQELIPFGPHGWAPFAMFHQPEVDGYLRDTATAHKNVSSFVGYEVTAVTNRPDHVSIQAKETDTDEKIECTASYLIACDGASSPIRQSLNVGRHDLGYNQDWLVVDVVMDEDALLPPEVMQVCDPDRLTTYVATKDPYRRWEFRLNEGETEEEMLQEERIFELLDPWTPRGSYEIRRAAVYQFHALVADKWREGRIFLAGDAAHQTPPFLGQGMNAGIRDMANLAWKLPAVISGALPATVLDSYFEERIAHSEDLIDWAVTIGKLMEFFAAQERAARGDGPEPTDPPALNAAYGQGRLIPPLRAGILINSQVTDTGFTGFQLEQPIVRDANGREFRLDEALGTGFAVVGRTDADMAISEEAQAIADTLGMAFFAVEGLEVMQWRMDPVFENSSAVLIRPDRYIFGHTDDGHMLDDLILELARKLGIHASKTATAQVGTEIQGDTK